MLAVLPLLIAMFHRVPLWEISATFTIRLRKRVATRHLGHVHARKTARGERLQLYVYPDRMQTLRCLNTVTVK